MLENTRLKNPPSDHLTIRRLKKTPNYYITVFKPHDTPNMRLQYAVTSKTPRKSYSTITITKFYNETTDYSIEFDKLVILRINNQTCKLKRKQKNAEYETHLVVTFSELHSAMKIHQLLSRIKACFVLSTIESKQQTRFRSTINANCY